MKYKITGHGETATVSAILDGNLYVAEGSHPNFSRIIDAVVNGGDESQIADLFDVSAALTKQFNSLSERVTFSNGSVYFDGDVVDNSLSDQITRFMEQGEDFAPLVKFMEKVYSNPNAHSREQLYTWLRDREFAITEDGNFLAYKSVWRDAENGYKSVSAGRAIVNGEEVVGQIPQSLGDVVTMPRSEVTFDPSVGCHTGLHAGTLDYAESFSGDVVLIVEINPRDVVSVPSDCDAQKLRCSRYEVKTECEGAVKRAVVKNGNFYEPLIHHFNRILDILWGDGEVDDEDVCEICGGTLGANFDTGLCDPCCDYYSDED